MASPSAGLTPRGTGGRTVKFVAAARKAAVPLAPRKTAFVASSDFKTSGHGVSQLGGDWEMQRALEKVLREQSEAAGPGGSDDMKKLGTCFTLREAVKAGILSKKQARTYRTEHAGKRSSKMQPAVQRQFSAASAESHTRQLSAPRGSHPPDQSNGEVVSIWDLCEWVSRPSFAFVEDTEKVHHGSDSLNHSSDEDACDSEVTEEEEPHKGNQSLNTALMVIKAVNSFKSLLSPRHDESAVSDAVAADNAEACHELKQELHVRPRGVQLSEPYTVRKRESEIVVEGMWEWGKCDGANSPQNPQVQLQAGHLTLMHAELLVEGPCGNIVQLWVLAKSRWGLPRPKLVHVLANVTEEGSPHGPRRIKCECELPANETITLVLACDGGDDAKGKREKQDRRRDQERKASPTSDVESDKTFKFKKKTTVHFGEDSDAPETHSADVTGPSSLAPQAIPDIAAGPVPSFRLSITTSRPLAHGPLLLRQRPKREEVPAFCRTAILKDFSKMAPVTADKKRTFEELCVEAANRTKSSPNKQPIEIDPQKIPIFAEAYLHAADTLDEDIISGLERASAFHWRQSRINCIAEAKQLVANYRPPGAGRASMAPFSGPEGRSMVRKAPTRRLDPSTVPSL